MTTPQWSQTIPDDLRRRLENVMGYRSFGPQDLWGEIREWLAANDLPPPAESSGDNHK